MAEKWLTVKEAAIMIGVTDRTVWRYISQGKITTKKEGNRLIIDTDSISDLIRGNDQKDQSYRDRDNELIQALRDQIQSQAEQLRTKDDQIRELQRALDQNQQLLAYAQLPWYRKLRHKALSAPEGIVDMEVEDANQSGERQ